jgi:threonyl-tRNA synthetase
VQLAVLPLSADQADAAWAAHRSGMDSGLRVEVSADGSLGSRIRQAALRKVPYAAVIGPREAAAGQVSLRLRDGRELAPMAVAEALRRIAGVVESRSIELSG